MASPTSPRMLANIQLEEGRAPIRLLVALGSPMDCQLLQTALTLDGSGHRLKGVACAVSKADILLSLSRGKIDVALISADLEDGPLAGLEVISEICRSYHNTQVVTLFNNWNDKLVLTAFRAGAMGVFCRSERKLDMLWRCIRAVHAGQVWANSPQLRLLLRTLRQEAPVRVVTSTGASLLTKRENEVAHLIVEGLPTKEIAGKLQITEHTVSNYLFRIYNKLGISSRVELVLCLMKQQEGKRLI